MSSALQFGVVRGAAGSHQTPHCALLALRGGDACAIHGLQVCHETWHPHCKLQRQEPRWQQMVTLTYQMVVCEFVGSEHFLVILAERS